MNPWLVTLETMRRRDPREQAYLQYLMGQCEAAGVVIRPKAKRFVGSKKQKCGGYFDGDELVVATHSPLWWETLLHEYNHLKQKLDGSWFAGRQETMIWRSFDLWIGRQHELSDERLLLCTRTIQRCELDCEQRTIALMRRHKFPTVDIEKYIKFANAYIWSYEAARLTRKWSNRRRPYKVKEIEKLLPGKLVREQNFGRLPSGFLEAYVRHCVSRKRV